MSLNVERIMTKEVKTCRENDTLQTAARIMWDADCGCVPIVDDADHVVGMITDRDVCMATMFKTARPQDLFVNSVMSRQVHSCRPNDSSWPIADGATTLVCVLRIDGAEGLGSGTVVRAAAILSALTGTRVRVVRARAAREAGAPAAAREHPRRPEVRRGSAPRRSPARGARSA